jgi:hypothetical protein
MVTKEQKSSPIAPPDFIKALIGIHMALMALLFVFTRWAGTPVVTLLSVLWACRKVLAFTAG